MTTTFGQELAKIQHLLRDPAQNIWSDELIRGLWNEVQHDLQARTGVLEDVSALAVPPRYLWAYLHDWERSHTPTGSHRALYNQDGHFAYCFTDEVTDHADKEVSTGMNGTVGGVTQPWEGWVLVPDYPPRIPFPSDYHRTKAIYWDEEPIGYRTKKSIEQDDPTWRSREGETFAYTVDSDEDNTFLLYPKPSSITWDDTSGSGMVTSVSGDTTEAEVGIITERTGSSLGDETGFATEVLGTTNNVLLVYDVDPTDIGGDSDELDWPDFLSKYVRYGVLARAFQADTDGYIPSLSGYWGRRYELGIRHIKRYQAKRTSDRDRRLQGEEPSGRRRPKHSRLPDAYPSV